MVLRAKWQRQAVMLFNHLEGGPAMTLTGPRRRKGNESHSVRCTESSDGVHRQRTCGLEGRLALVSIPSLCVQTSITIFIARNSSALQQERRSTWKYERRFALFMVAEKSMLFSNFCFVFCTDHFISASRQRLRWRVFRDISGLS